MEYAERLGRFNASEQWKACVNRVLDLGLWFRGFTQPVRIVDVGCGTGRFCALVKDAFGLGAEVIGTERRLDLIRAAEYCYGNRCFFRPQYGEEIPVADYSVHWLTCIHAISHVQDPEGLLQNIRRKMRRCGQVTFVVPNRYFDRLMFVKNVLTGYRSDPTILHHWTPGEFVTMLTVAGFRHVTVEMFGEYPHWGPRKDWAKAWFICTARVS